MIPARKLNAVLIMHVLYPSPSITIVGEVITVGKAYNQQITEGDRDICFYNEKCYRPVDLMDMPTNAGRSSKEMCKVQTKSLTMVSLSTKQILFQSYNHHNKLKQWLASD